jgi:enamine deaminase RidA (YjgF/YER057c/UK114 family)
MTGYLTDISDMDAIDAAVRRVFDDDGAYSARTTVQVAALGRPEFDVEISVVARLA